MFRGCTVREEKQQFVYAYQQPKGTQDLFEFACPLLEVLRLYTYLKWIQTGPGTNCYTVREGLTH